jgi:hypothetical protein
MSARAPRGRPFSSILDLGPDGCVVTGSFPASNFTVDVGVNGAPRDRRAQKQMIDPLSQNV